MTGTFMAILDSSIVNVSLPHIMSALEVNRDQIEWVATAFMITMVVVMPLTGWMVGRLGHKMLYLGSLALFTTGSALCAFAWNYHALVTARILQAIGGGAIQPVGMAIVADLFEPHERGRALGIWGTGIMVAPALGPTLGGYLTDWFGWRSIFSVNLPVGVLALLVGITVMRSDREKHANRVPFDLAGFVFLAMALIGGLLAVSEGQQEGWTSAYIYTCVGFVVVGMTMFIAVESTIKHPLLDLKLFRIANFTVSMIMAIFRAIGLFGGVFLLPIFLQSLAGYTTIQTGLWLMWGAVTVGIIMPIAGRLADRYQPSWLVAIGVTAAGVSLLLYSNLDPMSGPLIIIGPQVVRGVGLGFLMAPLLTTALNSVPRHQVATVSSFLNVAQGVGGAFGIAILNNFVTNQVQNHAVRLGEMMPVESPAFLRFAMRANDVMFHHVPGMLATPQIKAGAIAAGVMMNHATVMAFQNGFVFGGIIVLAGLPLCFLLRKPTHDMRKAPAAAPAAEEEPVAVMAE
jgi:DHA2 family multidrug resistance protein